MKNLLLLLFCLLMGCAPTLQDIQQSIPEHSLTSDIPPKTLADKIAYQATQEGMKTRLFRDWDQVKPIEINGVQKLLITVTSRGNILLIPYPPQPVAELTISPQSNGSKVEYQVAERWADKERFWEIVKNCAVSH